MHLLHFLRSWRELASYEPLANPFAWIVLLAIIAATVPLGLGPMPLIHFFSH